MKLALVSLDQSWENKVENKKKISVHLNELRSKNVDWVIFPEMTLTGYTMNVSVQAEDLNHSDTISYFSKCAKEYSIYISFGIILVEKKRYKNCQLVISPEGELISIYAKMHPFSYAKENLYFDSGEEIITTKIKNAKVGLSICYDLRFPELFQILSKSCSIIVNIANWPEKRVQHWLILLQARAIENQVYMIGVNRMGVDHNGLAYKKSSLLVSPEGHILSPEVMNEQVDVYEIDLNKVDEYRKSFPVKNDRKIDFYKNRL